MRFVQGSTPYLTRRRSRDVAVARDSRRHQLVGLGEDLSILIEASDESSGTSPLGQAVGARQHCGMNRELVDAEQLCAQRLLSGGRRRSGG